MPGAIHPLRVTFVLPHLAEVPVGGYIVAYRYARELRARGHDVQAVHSRRLTEPTSWLDSAQAHVWPMRVAGPRGRRAPKWVEEADRPAFRALGALSWVRDADAIIATSWETAAPVARMPTSKGRKFQLVQHFERWSAPDLHTLEASWRLPLHKLAIAKWLVEKAHELGVDDVTYCPNGVEDDQFFLEEPLEGRPPLVVWLASDVPFKRLDLAIEVSRRLHDSRPSCQQIAFGTGPRPQHLPPHVSYLESPSRAELRQVLNSASVFLHTSDAEGWPLPPAEAMLCGAALVATRNDGVTEYAVHDVNALLAPVGDADSLLALVSQLLQDEALRCRLAAQAITDVSRLTWSSATDRLLNALYGNDSVAGIDADIR